MRKTCILIWCCMVVLVLSGCSVNISQPAIPTPVFPVSSASPAGNLPNNATPAPGATMIPITWADLNLTGRFIYISTASDDTRTLKLQTLNLATGELRTIFTTIEGGWIFYVSVSPDAKNVVMSYIPPAEGNSIPSRDLYIMPMDGSKPPQLLFSPPTSHDHYVQAEWSPDGKYIYYAHYDDTDKRDEQLNPPYDIFRMSYPDGKTEKIADHAFWPRLSSDSTKLLYIALEPVTGKNELFLANADGSNPQRVTFSGSDVPEIIDAPIFSPDGQSILFSAPTPTQSYQPNWLDRLMDVQIAKAHSVPSDWWVVPISGGAVTRLTQLQTTNLFASISPDGKQIASTSGGGLFVMKPDGSNLTLLIPDSQGGTVSWIP